MFTLATGTPLCPVGKATSIKSSSSSSNFTTVLDFLSTALATGDDGSTASLIGTSSSLNVGRSSSSAYVFLAGGVSGIYESDSFVRLVFAAGLFSDIVGDRTRVFLRVSVFMGRMRVADRLVAFVSISPSRSSIKSTSAALTVGLSRQSQCAQQLRIVTQYLWFGCRRSTFRIEVLANAVVDLLLFLCIFFSFPFGCYASDEAQH